MNCRTFSQNPCMRGKSHHHHHVVCVVYELWCVCECIYVCAYVSLQMHGSDLSGYSQISGFRYLSKALKMALRCILSVNSQFSGF